MKKFDEHAHVLNILNPLQALPNNAKLHHNYATTVKDNDVKEYHFRVAMRIYPPYGAWKVT